MNLIRLCEKYHTLPNSGGLLDQDSLFVLVLNEVSVWDQQKIELDQAKSHGRSAAA